MSFNEEGNNITNSNDDARIVKVRGLPWSTTIEEIIDFFSGCNIANGREGVFIVMSKEGRPSGEAFVEMETDEDVEKALKKDHEYVGTRYIEVFKCKRSEMEWVVRRSGNSLENTLDDGCVRLRGLPFDCSKEEISQFFTGLEIVPNGINLPTDVRGRTTGEAFVQFRTKENAEKALLKHKEKIGHRYIEIFRSSLHEVFPEGRRGGMNYPPRPSPYDARDRFGGPNRFRGGGGGGPGPGGMGMGMGPGPGPNGPNGPMMPPGGMNGMHRGYRGGYSDDMDDDDWSWRWGPRGGGGGGGPPMGNMGNMGNNMRGFNGNFGNNGNFMGGGGGGGNGGFGGPPMSGPPGPHMVYMRGLPFRATKQDIADFFRPIIPLSIDLNPNDKGRAEVEFRSNDDALLAMSKDKSFMSHRYIELFLDKPGSGSNKGGRDGGSRFKKF